MARTTPAEDQRIAGGCLIDDEREDAGGQNPQPETGNRTDGQ